MSLSKSSDVRWEHSSRSSDKSEDDHYEGSITEHPNLWSRIRDPIRPYFAEFLGVAILILFGTGVDCAAVLGGNTEVTTLARGTYISINFGWACGAALGVWVSGGISGGHINPAVTIGLATFRGFPWKKVPGYILAQLLGALVGGSLVYANYYHAINIVEGGPHVRTMATAGLFSTFALDYMTNVSAFFDEFLGAAIMFMVVLAMSDQKNGPPPAGLAPLVVFVLILGIGLSFGMQTGYAINPARDLGPRMMLAMVGYGKQVFTFRNQYWLWCPVIAPVLGALCGAFVYDGLIYTGDESPFNKPNAETRRRRQHATANQRQPAPAGPGAESNA